MNAHTGTQREICNHVLKGKTLIKRFKLQDEVKKNLKENSSWNRVFSYFLRLKYRTNTFTQECYFVISLFASFSFEMTHRPRNN